MEEKIVEILQYTLKKGSGAAFHQIMKDVSVPLHTRHAIDVVRYGNSLHDADSYFLIRAFDSEKQMETILDTFYSSDDWRAGPREDIVSCIEVSLRTVLVMSRSGVEGMRD